MSSITPNNSSIPDPAFQRHFTLKELSSPWKLSQESIRKLCVDEPDVVKLKLGKKRAKARYSVPESVAQRLHTRLLNGG